MPEEVAKVLNTDKVKANIAQIEKLALTFFYFKHRINQTPKIDTSKFEKKFSKSLVV